MTLLEVTEGGDFVALSPAPVGAVKAAATKSCFYCQKLWPILKRTCWSDADGTGCGRRIRGPLEECTGVAVFDDVVVERKYSPVKMEFDSNLGSVVKKELKLASVPLEAAAAAFPPFWFEHTEEVHQILLGNPGSKDFNLKVLSVIADQTKLKGHVPDEEVLQYAGLVCSDGGADFMSSHGASDFGEHDSMIPIIASGHEEMNFLKTLLKVVSPLQLGLLVQALLEV